MRNNATALENLPCLLCIGPIEKKYILSSHKLFSFFSFFSEKEESKKKERRAATTQIRNHLSEERQAYLTTILGAIFHSNIIFGTFSEKQKLDLKNLEIFSSPDGLNSRVMVKSGIGAAFLQTIFI